MRKADRKVEIYNCIKRNCDKGVSPTIREICAQLQVASTSTVHLIVKELAKEGILEKTDKLTRAIKIPGTLAFQVPILKRLDKEDTFTNLKNIDKYIPVNFEVPDDEEVFGVVMNDSSLSSHGILEGDYVIAKKTDHVENNTLAVVTVGPRIWVRYYVKENHMIELRANDENVKPILTDHCKVVGKVCGCIRYSI